MATAYRTFYHLKLPLVEGVAVSDHKDVTFGVREITYELSLFDSDEGHLRRNEVSPTVARQSGIEVVDVRHTRRCARQRSIGLLSSELRPGERSSAVIPVSDCLHVSSSPASTACASQRAGGNWGMDDSRKRVSREQSISNHSSGCIAK